MANPKVFEFAKEIGMTPLALMDKIREWHFPVKSHMAELDPEVLEQIRLKLRGNDKKSEDKPKKVTTRKVTPKKVTEVEPDTSKDIHGKSTVVRRKSKDSEEELLPPAKPGAARIIKKVTPKPEVSELEPEFENEKIPVTSPFPEVVNSSKIKPAEKQMEMKAEPKAELTAEIKKDHKIEARVELKKVEPKKETPSDLKAESVVEPSVEVKAEIKAEPKAEPKVEAKTSVTGSAAVPGSSVPVARKKEVSVGASGVSSNSTPMQPKRNIVGRMDLSRVQAPPSSGGQYGGGSGPREYRPEGFVNRSTGGFIPGGGGVRPSSAPRPGGVQNRGLRAGFVAAPAAPIIEDYSDDQKGKKNFDKKSKKLEGAAPTLTPKEKELEEIKEFNAVEFRKREMVFQPKKKKGTLERQALQTQITTPKASKRILKVYGSMKLSDVCNELGIKAPQLTKALMTSGVMASMSTELDFDTIALIVPEFGWEAQNVLRTADEFLGETAFGEMNAEKVFRPPVVTVMGHVDHGKTSLLDVIRKANVASGEAGGITQHIGAYNVKLEDGKTITFLDTPGHEAFTAMRARGANATDIAIIVVAADDGLMPQTAEAINHAKAANVPIIVAINKMDKPGANPERIKQQLTEFELVPEEWGGTTIFCPVSALKKEGIKELLEQITLVAEMQELKANPLRSGTGIVIESKLEKGKGPVATLLVKDGSVKVGQFIVAGLVKGKIKSLMNDRGERVESMGPGLPVEVLGLETTPSAGDRFDVVESEVQAEKVAAIRKEHADKLTQSGKAKLTLEDIFSKVNKGDVKELAIILKADVHGSLEAILGMLAKASTKEVKTRVLHAGVGGISESDVLLANTSKGIIIGFNVRPDTGAQSKAKQFGIEIRTYSIVYELMDDIKKAMTGMLTPDVVEKVMGRVEVRNIFNVPKLGTIAGCFVIDGKVQRSNSVRLIRDGKIVYEGKLASLKRFKDDAKEVAQGFECGVGIENFNDVKIGDQIEAFIKEEVARELTAELNA
ncbi:MAG: translation initiation factor IF-2 [Deltaproteobacteria bacterium]|nr:translation initiation factor IF-2 [Deltaproteobacteria bacterium]